MIQEARRQVLCALALAIVATGAVYGQGRGGAIWTTAGGDAQRTSWVRTDPKISRESVQKPDFQFLWKRKLEGEPGQLNALTQPVFSSPGFITYKGFKGLAYVGGSADNVFSIDYDLNKPFWMTHLTTGATGGGTPACPGGLTTVTRSTAAGPNAAGRGRAAGGTDPGARGAAPAAPAPAGRGPGGGGGFGGGRGGADYVNTLSSGGMLHSLNPQTGTDTIPPVKLLPANATVVGSIVVDGVFYAATADNCGGAPNGVWAVDLAKPERSVTTWETKGGSVVGMTAPTFGTDGSIYVSTGNGASPVSNAVVSLDSKALTEKDWFSPGRSAFTSAPVAFQHNGKDLIVAANRDGRLYLLDGAALGGADHKTPLARSPQYASASDFASGVASWQDAQGTRWILASSAGPVPAGTSFPMAKSAATNGAIVAFTLVEQNGLLTLQPQWTSRDLMSPLTPTVVNGVVFALSSGEFRGGARTTAAERTQRSTPAVLYALDAATGQQLWSSGTTITSFARGAGPAVDDSQVYVVAGDGTLYAFGFPTER